MRLSRRIILTYRVVLLSLLFAAPRASLAQTPVQQAPDVTTPWTDAVRAFAGKIAPAIGAARAISLDVVNISALSSTDAGSIERQLQAALGGAGFQIAPQPPAEIRVHVTLSEGTEGYLWVAEIHSQAGDQVAMMSAHTTDSAASPAKPVPVLRKTFLLRQGNPILDFAVGPARADDGSRFLFILEPDQVTVFRQLEGGWTKVDAEPIAHSRPWPRDIRGEIVVAGVDSSSVSAASGLKVYLPGIFCAGSMQSKLEIACRQNPDTAWPLGGKTKATMPADRNYFNIPSDGAPSGWPPSYSVASKPDEDRPLKILTAVNGSAQLFGDSPQNAVATFWRWGDEFASLTGCEDSWNVLATGTGDWTQRDDVQDFEVADRQATMAGQLLEFSGPILALWPSDDGKSVRAVSRNLQTGMYEASLINLYCGN
jgi:hypothetical protein